MTSNKNSNLTYITSLFYLRDSFHLRVNRILKLSLRKTIETFGEGGPLLFH